MYEDDFNYLKDGIISISFYHNCIIRLKNLAIKYIIIGNLLYRMYFDGALLRCLMRHEVEMAFYQAHDGEYGGKFNAKLVYQKFLKLVYYLPTMLEDCELHVKRYDQYQKNANIEYSPSHGLHSIISPWPFSILTLAFIGKFNLISRYFHKFIVTARENFIKWVEAIPINSAKGGNIVEFLIEFIIFRYGVPSKLLVHY